MNMQLEYGAMMWFLGPWGLRVKLYSNCTLYPSIFFDSPSLCNLAYIDRCKRSQHPHLNGGRQFLS